MSRFAPLPEPPYYAVVFAAQLRPTDDPSDYARTAARMVELASAREGYLGMESTRDAAGFGMTAETPEGPRQLRLPFDPPIRDAGAARTALVAMAERAREMRQPPE